MKEFQAFLETLPEKNMLKSKKLTACKLQVVSVAISFY